MAAAGEVTGMARLLSKFRRYHEKHPIIVAYGTICTVLTFVWGYMDWNTDKASKCIMKYRKEYIVIRPDDPQVKIIKRGRIGLDY